MPTSPGRSTPSSRVKSVKPTPKDEDMCIELRSTRIEPMSRIDTNEFKDGHVTRKFARWFQGVGGSSKAAARSINALGGQRTHVEYDHFHSLNPTELAAGCEEDPDDPNGETLLQAQMARKAAQKARGLEERLWEARHKSRSGEAAMSSVSWRGPTRGHQALSSGLARSGRPDLSKTEDASARLREQALWLPVSENHLARHSRPCPDWSGAMLFEGQHFEPESRDSPSSKGFAVDASSDPEPSLRRSSSQREPSSPREPASPLDTVALELWTGFSDRVSTRHRNRSGRTRGMVTGAAARGSTWGHQEATVKALQLRTPRAADARSSRRNVIFGTAIHFTGSSSVNVR
jgi:hypothetical protein